MTRILIGLGTSLASGLLVATTIVSVVLVASHVPTRKVVRSGLSDALSSD